jgi:hypothetical protein
MVIQGASSDGDQLGSCKEHGVSERQEGLRRIRVSRVSIFEWSNHQFSVLCSVVPREQVLR